MPSLPVQHTRQHDRAPRTDILHRLPHCYHTHTDGLNMSKFLFFATLSCVIIAAGALGILIATIGWDTLRVLGVAIGIFGVVVASQKVSR